MRLIDADVLEKELKKDIMGGLNYSWYINNAPTVDVLDKIRTEIEDCKQYQFETYGIQRYFKIDDIWQIIDKYKGE